MRRVMSVFATREVCESRVRSTDGCCGEVGLRGIARKAARAGTSTALETLLRALAKQELQATHELTIQPLRRTRQFAACSAADGAVDVDVRVACAGSACILVEPDGELSWPFRTRSQATPKPQGDLSKLRSADRSVVQVAARA